MSATSCRRRCSVSSTTSISRPGTAGLPLGHLAVREVLEGLRARRVAELAQRLGLDLPDALARDLEALSDLLEGVVGLLADAEAQAQDLLLARRERGEDLARLL